MGLVHVDDLQPGMELAADLANTQGRILLPKGTVIESNHLRVMKIWGATEADIVGIDQQEAVATSTSELEPEHLCHAQDDLEGLFCLTDRDSEPLAEIFRLCVLRRARLIARGAPLRDDADWCPEIDMSSGADAACERLDMAELVSREVALTSFPAIYFQIVDAVKTPGSSATYLADIVGRDPSVSARLLRLVNSPLYGLPSRIDSITRAVALMGVNEISTLALGISVATMFDGISSHLLNMKSFWQHSFACAMLAKILAGYIPGVQEERFFVGGLLHDIGRIIYCKAAPDCAVAPLREARTRPESLTDMERAFLGFDHAALAGALAREWKFPAALVGMIEHHHEPSRAPAPQEAAIIHVADLLAVALQYGGSGECYVPIPEPGAWQLLQLPVSVLSGVVSQVERQLDDVFAALLHNGE
ncbi:MAG: HDOD domain-containing protein [Desulfovibrionaceae bacterium]